MNITTANKNHTATSSSSYCAEDDDARVVGVLSELSEAVSKVAAATTDDDDEDEPLLARLHRDADVRSCLARLLVRETETPSSALRALAPRLFGGRDGDGVAVDHALVSLTLLVSSRPTELLRPAARAVADFAKRSVASSTELTVDDALAELLAEQLAGVDAEAARSASETVVALCSQRSDAPARVLVSRAYDAWCRVRAAGGDAVAAVRCAATVTTVATASNDAFDAFEASGSAHLLLECVRDDGDVLLQASYLDLVEQLATEGYEDDDDEDRVEDEDHRAAWLLSKPVSSTLLDMAHDDDFEFQGQALVLAASLCRLLPRGAADDARATALASRARSALRLYRVAVAANATDDVPRMRLAHAVSSLASSSDEALADVLDDDDDDGLSASWLALSSRAKLKVVALGSVARCLRLVARRKQRDNAAASSDGRLRLWRALGETNGGIPTSSLLASLFRASPHPEVRVAAYDLVRAFAETTGAPGIRALEPELLTSLTDGNDDGSFFVSEPTKEGREARHAAARAIVAAEGAELALSDDAWRALRRTSDRGPHHATARRWDVAVDE